jgi:ABC-type Na+ efflux pump permease subunit
VVQSGLFVATFYAAQLIWERDRGVLTKLLVTPTARSALMLAKAFAAGADALAAGADALARVTAALAFLVCSGRYCVWREAVATAPVLVNRLACSSTAWPGRARARPDG